MTTSVTYATTFQLGSLLARLHLKQKGKKKKIPQGKTTASEPQLSKEAKEGMRRMRLPEGLNWLVEFGELVSEYCVPKQSLDPHLLAGAIEGYTKVRPFSSQELEFLPSAVIFAMYKSAHRANPRAKEMLSAAKKLEKSLK